MCLRRLKKKRPIPRKGVGMGRSNCLGSTAGLLLLRRIFCGYGVPAATARSSDLQLHLTAGYRASEFGNHGAIWRIAAHLKRDVAAVHLAVGNLHRRRSWRSPATAAAAARTTAAATHAGNCSGQRGAISRQIQRNRASGSATAARHFKSPLAGDRVRRQCDEGHDKQDQSYKKQLLGHSNSLGVIPPRDVTPRTKEKRPCLRRSVNQDR